MDCGRSRDIEAFDKAFDEFDRLDALMSTWKDGSDILRLNDAAGKSAVVVSAEVAKCFTRRGKEVSGR